MSAGNRGVSIAMSLYYRGRNDWLQFVFGVRDAFEKLFSPQPAQFSKWDEFSTSDARHEMRRGETQRPWLWTVRREKMIITRSNAMTFSQPITVRSCTVFSWTSQTAPNLISQDLCKVFVRKSGGFEWGSKRWHKNHQKRLLTFPALSPDLQIKPWLKNSSGHEEHPGWHRVWRISRAVDSLPERPAGPTRRSPVVEGLGSRLSFDRIDRAHSHFRTCWWIMVDIFFLMWKILALYLAAAMWWSWAI